MKQYKYVWCGFVWKGGVLNSWSDAWHKCHKPKGHDGPHYCTQGCPTPVLEIPLEAQ